MRERCNYAHRNEQKSQGDFCNFQYKIEKKQDSDEEEDEDDEEFGVKRKEEEVDDDPIMRKSPVTQIEGVQ